MNVRWGISGVCLCFLLTACNSVVEDAPVGEVEPTLLQVLPSATASPYPTGEVDKLLAGLQATAVQFVLPTAAPVVEADWRPPPYQVPLALRPEDHFYLQRPIPSGEVNWPHPFYRYGSTYFGKNTIHTGVDLSAEYGASVVAAGPGEVVWEGYGLYRGIEDPEDPYGLAIAIRHDFGHSGKELYTVYAHLSSSFVGLGQRVSAGDVIGSVGDTGHATGPHLHFEVRLGKNAYFSTRNPELWMAPPEGWGVLAGLIADTAGQPLEEKIINIRSLPHGKQWQVWTYALETVHGDDAYGENFVISDLPAGPYEVRVDYVGKSFTTRIYVHPGMTNLVQFKGRRGFLPVEHSDVDLQHPPAP